MNRTYVPPPSAGPPVVLGVDLTIANHEGLRRSLQSAFGVSTRAINLRIDPGMDLIFLCETTIPSSLPCLAAITRSNVTAVKLRDARLTWSPEPDHPIGRGTPTLGALESGSCFLMANNRKVLIASFSPRAVHPTHVEMEKQGQLNLLDFLRADTFTLEVSGTNRRRLARPLNFSVVLSFEVQVAPGASA
ncbi:hypothetical protein [Hymenobacter wooponensis]|uniref:Uncharacterized protein n=1 Tax=Hymenobacter wooponensis TaxID=1525360 RepID=A0A4Z0MTA1_9BACT|nr:hypothetical protein [Hymenobacter wooponensis]TGD82659.1 hypothetical protein EU557_02430 [Hymenobacter wooponensis]